MQVICDFDGTITLKDTTDLVLATLADPAWEMVEAMWVRGEISGADCMRRQVAMIDADDARLDAVLDQVELDPGFADFVAWCEARELAVAIVSDGVDYFIDRILARHGLAHLPVIANRWVPGPPRRLEQPWSRPGCAAGAGVCKCDATVRARHDGMVFIGDGRSDFCVSAQADILFAKDQLAAYAAARDQAFHPFETFDDVTRVLARLVAEPSAGRALRTAAL